MHKGLFLLTNYGSMGSLEGRRVRLTVHTVRGTDTTGSPWTASARVTFMNTGVLRYSATGDETTGTGDEPLEWIGPSRPDTDYADDYEVRATQISAPGAGTRTGTLNVWLGLETDRFWDMDNSTSGDASWVIQFEIRHKVSLIVYADEELTLATLDGFS